MLAMATAFASAAAGLADHRGVVIDGRHTAILLDLRIAGADLTHTTCDRYAHHVGTHDMRRRTRSAIEGGILTGKEMANATSPLVAAQRTTVDAIVVSLNTKRLLQDCLRSLRDSAYTVDRLFVVDNASNDGSADMVRAEFPEAVLVRMPRNVGFARANNAAFARCSGDTILLLNSDARLSRDGLGAMVEELRSGADIGAVGPMLVGWDGRVQYEGGRRDPSLAGEFGNITHLNTRLPSSLFGHYLMNEWDHRTSRDVDVLSGACMVLRATALSGRLFRDDFYMYGEDVELCQRLRIAGWRVRYLAQARVLHKGAATSQKAHTRMRIAGVISMAQLLSRQRGLRYAVAYVALVPLAWPLGCLVRRMWPR